MCCHVIPPARRPPFFSPVTGRGFVEEVSSRYFVHGGQGVKKKQVKINLGSRGFGGRGGQGTGDGRRGSLGDGGFRRANVCICTTGGRCVVLIRHVPYFSFVLLKKRVVRACLVPGRIHTLDVTGYLLGYDRPIRLCTLDAPGYLPGYDGVLDTLDLSG